MTDDDFRNRIAEIEAWGRNEIALLSEVPKRSKPRSGESNIIHDAVASMAKRLQNAKAIEEIETTVAYLSEVIAADYYQEPRPKPQTKQQEEQLEKRGWR